MYSYRAALLLALWGSMLLIAPSGVVSAKTSPPKSFTTTNNAVYDLPFASFNCTYNQTTNGAFSMCSDGLAPKNAETLNLNSQSRLKNWVKFCAEQCYQKNYKNPNDGKSCVGYSRRTPTTCTLITCLDGAYLLPASATKIKGKVPKPVAVQMGQVCFDALPTASPTTARPTPKPTNPTSAPVPPCAIDTSNTYAKEFESLEGRDTKLSMYTLIQPDRKLCELVEPRNLLPSGIEIVNNFGCTLEACVRWCSYASLCTFAMFSPVTKTCYRANNLELTDNSDSFKQYWDEKWVVYMKNTQSAIMYFSGKCNELIGATCNADKECGWNKGKKGYNDNQQGGSAGGYCGRIKCNAATSG